MIRGVALFWQGLVDYKAGCNIDSWLINGCRSQYEGTQQVVLIMSWDACTLILNEVTNWRLCCALGKIPQEENQHGPFVIQVLRAIALASSVGVVTF